MENGDTGLSHSVNGSRIAVVGKEIPFASTKPEILMIQPSRSFK